MPPTAIESLRKIILAAHPEIGEGIKWNSPSFYYQTPTKYFATIHTRSGSSRLILHQGAKATGAPKPEIHDPQGLLDWLGKDRCSIVIPDAKQLQANETAIQDIIRQWIAAL